MAPLTRQLPGQDDIDTTNGPNCQCNMRFGIQNAKYYYYYPPFARRARYLFYCMFVCLFGQRFLSNPLADSRHILHAGVAWVGTCLLPFWGSATPVGGKNWENDMGVVSFVHRTATISISLSDAKCSPICRAQTCAHSGVEPSRSDKAFLQGGPKSSKKFRIIHHFETLRPYISETIKNRGK